MGRRGHGLINVDRDPYLPMDSVDEMPQQTFAGHAFNSYIISKRIPLTSFLSS